MSTDTNADEDTATNREVRESNRNGESPPPTGEPSESDPTTVDQSMCDREIDMKYYYLY